MKVSKAVRVTHFLSPIRHLRCRQRRFVLREWPLSSYHIAEKRDGHVYLDEPALGLCDGSPGAVERFLPSNPPPRLVFLRKSPPSGNDCGTRSTNQIT